MKTSLQQLLVGLGCCWAILQLPGCMPFTGTVPNWGPRQPNGIYNPQPYPGASPWYPIGNPNVPGGYPQFPPGGPSVPIGMNPVPGLPVVIVPPNGPGPVPGPSNPTQPDPNFPDPSFPDPVGPPTIPVNAPIAAPTQPRQDSYDFWSPWPLPPRGGQLALRDSDRSSLNGPRGFLPSEEHGVSRPQLGQFVSASSNEDLKYRGGKVIRDLSYVNLYVSGDTEWTMSDVDRIDRSLEAAMQDQHLNNVLLQYFNNQAIRSTALASHPLTGFTPTTVSRGDIQDYITYLFDQGFLQPFDLQNTVINLLLPPETILTTRDSASNGRSNQSNQRALDSYLLTDESDDVDSAAGLGGYHGSVVTANGERVYFAACVYSDRYANGVTNGIPVLSDPWKNVVATLYHQLMEVRTNPDVEDALRESSDLDSGRILGWVSDSGLEIGDIPIRGTLPISRVIREVPLANGDGTVPVQLPYSVFTGGPEGPISQPHPLPPQ